MGTYDGRDRIIQDSKLLFSNAAALPNNTNADSTNIIDLRGTQYFGVPMRVVVDLSEHTIASTKTFDIKVLECDTVGGTYAEIVRKHFIADDEITGRHLIGIAKSKRFLKLNYETTDNLSGETVTAFLSPLL